MRDIILKAGRADVYMLKQLRTRFIVAIAVSAFALLTGVLVSVNLMIIINMHTKNIQLLESIAENNGVIIDASSDYLANVLDYLNPLNETHNFDSEISYTTRFFYVRFTNDGVVETVNTDHISAIDKETATIYAIDALKTTDMSGYIHSNYMFLINFSDDYGMTVYFMDISDELMTIGLTVTVSLVIGLVYFLILFLIIVLISKRVVRPLAENAIRQKQFITDAGHELKTPISIISANTEVLEMMYGENEWLTSIHNQTNRMSDLIKNLLVLSKAEEKTKEILSEVPISDIVSATVASFSALAHRADKRLYAEVQPTLTVWGNEKAVAELTSILLDNAVKYAPVGSKVQLNLYKKGRQVILETINALSPGTQVDTERLFDRFYRSEKSRSRQTGGYGIGLSIASAIVKSHKATIQAETEDGKISFTVIFNTKN